MKVICMLVIVIAIRLENELKLFRGWLLKKIWHPPGILYLFKGPEPAPSNTLHRSLFLVLDLGSIPV